MNELLGNPAEVNEQDGSEQELRQLDKREKDKIGQARRRRTARQLIRDRAIRLKWFIVYGIELDALIDHEILHEKERKNPASVEAAIRQLIKSLNSEEGD